MNQRGKESLNDLAVEAGRKAVQMAEVEPDHFDLVLLCTSTPEDLFGGALTRTQPHRQLLAVMTSLPLFVRHQHKTACLKLEEYCTVKAALEKPKGDGSQAQASTQGQATTQAQASISQPTISHKKQRIV